MNDRRKAAAIVTAAGILIGFALLGGLADELGITRAAGTLERRLYFEKAIAPRDLGLHRAEHWRVKGD